MTRVGDVVTLDDTDSATLDGQCVTILAEPDARGLVAVRRSIGGCHFQTLYVREICVGRINGRNN